MSASDKRKCMRWRNENGEIISVFESYESKDEQSMQPWKLKTCNIILKYTETVSSFLLCYRCPRLSLRLKTLPLSYRNSSGRPWIWRIKKRWCDHLRPLYTYNQPRSPRAGFYFGVSIDIRYIFMHFVIGTNSFGVGLNPEHPFLNTPGCSSFLLRALMTFNSTEEKKASPFSYSPRDISFCLTSNFSVSLYTFIQARDWHCLDIHVKAILKESIVESALKLRVQLPNF